MKVKKSFSSSRWIQICGLLILLALLVLYGYRENPFVTLRMCLGDPHQYDGQEINIAQEATVAQLLTNGFLLRQMDQIIRVQGDSQNASPGDYVRMKAIFHKENYLELKRLYVAKGRRLKMIVSVVPVMYILFLFFKTYRFDCFDMLFKERN